MYTVSPDRNAVIGRAGQRLHVMREKAVAAVNEKFAEPLERLENSAALLGEVERLAGAGEIGRASCRERV